MSTTPQTSQGRPGSPRRRWIAGGVAGLLAGVAAVAASEAVAALVDGVTSPLLAVGNRAVDATPRPLKEFAIERFGENDKPVLIGGVVATVAVLALLIGVVGVRRPRVALGAFLVLSAVATAAGLTDRSSTASPVLRLLPALALVVVGVAALLLLLRALRTPANAPTGSAGPAATEGPGGTRPPRSRPTRASRPSRAARAACSWATCCPRTSRATAAGRVRPARVPGDRGRRRRRRGRRRRGPPGVRRVGGRRPARRHHHPEAGHAGAEPRFRRQPGRARHQPVPDLEQGLLPGRHRAAGPRRPDRRLQPAHPRHGRQGAQPVLRGPAEAAGWSSAGSR